jgi:hypothetical protein
VTLAQCLTVVPRAAHYGVRLFTNTRQFYSLGLMLTISTANQRRPRCRQCGCLSDFASVEDPSHQAELFEIFAHNEFLKFVPRIREFTNCSIGEAKATYLHLALAGRVCHRCQELLPSGEVVDCSKCHSLNIVWQSQAETQAQSGLS